MTSPDNPWERTRRKRRANQFSEKRETLLNAAAALFREKGYDGASLNDLADVLNITKPTIYHYVQNKEALLLDIVCAAQDQVLASCWAVQASEDTGYEKLRRIMLDYARVMASDYGACLVSNTRMVNADPKSRAEVTQRIAEADRLIYKVLDQGRSDGSLEFTDRTVALHTLFGSLNWIPSWAKSDGPLSPDQVAEAQVDLLLRGVGAKAAVAQPKAAKPARAKKS